VTAKDVPRLKLPPNLLPKKPRGNPDKAEVARTSAVLMAGMGSRCWCGGGRGALIQPEWIRGNVQTKHVVELRRREASRSYRREATTRLRNREAKGTAQDAFELKVPCHLREVNQC